MNRKYIIIAAVILLIIVSILAVIYKNMSKYPANTGGSGVSQPGTLILKGYEVESNDNSKIRLGTFFSSTQQKNISLFLGALLFEKEPLASYSGTVQPGSVDVNYQTSVITFKVKIKKPDTLYTVTYNTLNDDMNVFDEKNQSLKPTLNPDGTPFKSFRTSSRLAQ